MLLVIAYATTTCTGFIDYVALYIDILKADGVHPKSKPSAWLEVSDYNAMIGPDAMALRSYERVRTLDDSTTYRGIMLSPVLDAFRCHLHQHCH